MNQERIVLLRDERYAAAASTAYGKQDNRRGKITPQAAFRVKERADESLTVSQPVEAIILEARILNEYRTIAVVGASPNPERASYGVASYLMEHGYHVIPVNPNAPEILGKTSYPNLSSVPEKVEVVDIFRRSEEVMPIVEEAIKIGAKAVWMQEGIINEEAAAKARAAGLLVVMDRCMFKEHQRLMQEGKLTAS